jgi:hypothetical protein
MPGAVTLLEVAALVVVERDHAGLQLNHSRNRHPSSLAARARRGERIGHERGTGGSSKHGIVRKIVGIWIALANARPATITASLVSV